MTDVLQPLNGEPLTISQLPVKNQSSAFVGDSSNLIQNHKRLSLLAQIYNWQPIGVIVKFHLPIVNVNNTPLFALRVTPNWIPWCTFSHQANSDMFYGRRVTAWSQEKGWVLPVSYDTLVTGGDAQKGLPTAPIGDGVTVVEYDDHPDIAFWNQFATGWKGGINYQLRTISNVTTQGKIAISRQYDIEQPVFTYDPSTQRTPMPLSGSQSYRRKNAQMILDLPSIQTFEINCPYISKQSYTPNIESTSAAYTAAGPMNSYIFFDVISTISPSAGAAEFSFELFIQAAPDFEYVFPVAPTNRILASVKQYRSVDNSEPFYAFGKDTNLTYTDENTMVVKT